MMLQDCSMCSSWAPKFDLFVELQDYDDDVPNIGLVCSEHASRPQPHFSTWPITKFIGNFVKLGFDIPDEIADQVPFLQKGTQENMWVAVTGIAEDVDHDLHGYLYSAPQFACPWMPLSELEFKLIEIEDISNGPVGY